MSSSHKSAEYDLKERTLDFAARCVKLCMEMGNGFVQEHIARQLLRSSTGAMANYAEAVCAESKKDMIHKQGIARKELQESEVWLRLIQKVGLITPTSRLDSLLDENIQLCKIFTKAKQTLTSSNKPTVTPKPSVAPLKS
jgi:four helix bundle protein